MFPRFKRAIAADKRATCGNSQSAQARLQGPIELSSWHRPVEEAWTSTKGATRGGLSTSPRLEPGNCVGICVARVVGVGVALRVVFGILEALRLSRTLGVLLESLVLDLGANVLE